MDYKDYQQQNIVENLHFWHKARLNFIQLLIKKAYKDFSPKRTILDIGSGTGLELEVLKKFGNVYAFDFNPKALSIAKHQGYHTILGDIETDKLDNNHYDCICCFDLLEHLNNDQAVLSKIYSSLKPGGYFIFTVPAFKLLFSPHDIALEHKRRYNRLELINKLNQANFTNIKTGYWNSFLFPLEAAIRIIKKIIHKFFPFTSPSPESASPPKIINNFLFNILNSENKLVKKNITLPFGFTIYGIAKK